MYTAKPEFRTVLGGNWANASGVRALLFPWSEKHLPLLRGKSIRLVRRVTMQKDKKWLFIELVGEHIIVFPKN